MILGVVSLAYQGITYTDRDTVDLGPVEITTEDTERIPLPPVLGALALAAGAILTVAGLRKPAGG